jgi:hypothetical protein
MIDIYEQKAKKYKYKYLKLKNTYIAKGGNGYWKDLEKIFEPVITPIVQKVKEVSHQIEQVVKPISQLVLLHNINYKVEFIGSGTYGCIISPPLQFNNNNNINIKFNKNINNIFTSNDYVGKLLSCDDNAFNDEYDEFKKLEKIDPEANHRSQLIFAAYMSIEELKENLNFLLNNVKNNETYAQLKKLEKCLINPQKKIINYSSSKNYGYIISTRVGKSFEEIITLKNNKFLKNFTIILEKLKESIKDLIKKFYDKDFIHGDIKFDNMTITLNDKDELDDKSKIYFIDFGFMQKYDDYEKLKYKFSNFIYPDILYFFYLLNTLYTREISKSELNTSTISKSKLIEILNIQKKPKSHLSTLLKKTRLNNIDYSCFFHSLEDNKEYPLKDIYTECIKPIMKNSDIYALSLYIHSLFIITFDLDLDQDSNNLKILNELLINALYNNIDGPDELIIYIDAIINSIKNNNYNLISEKIKERRNNLEPKIPFYYYYHDKYIDLNNSEKKYT